MIFPTLPRVGLQLSGISMQAYSSDPRYSVEIQSSPDGSTWTSIIVLSPTQLASPYLDRQPIDGVARFYRARQTDGVPGGRVGPWLTSTPASGKPVASVLIPVPNDPTSPVPVAVPLVYTAVTLPTLPDPAFPPGTVMVSGTDAVTYQNVANVWTAATPPPPTGSEYIKIVTGLPTLPNGAYPINQVVLNTVDSKLYRNKANVWTAEVPTVDLTGSITTAQITNGAVTLPKLEFSDGTVIDMLHCRGTGSDNNANRLVDVGGRVDVNSGTGRGLCLSVLKRSDHTNLTYRSDGTGGGTLAANQVYDVYGTDADRLALKNALVELRTNGNATRSAGTYGQDIIVILTSFDAIALQPGYANAPALVAEMLLHGATQAAAQLNFRVPYLLIGVPGIGEGRGIEIITGDAGPHAEYSALMLDGNLPGLGGYAEQRISANLIQAGAVVAGKIAANAVTAGTIAAGGVIAGNIVAGTITATELATDSVTTTKILAGAVTAAKITVSQLSAISADLGTITAGLIQDAGATRGIVLAGSVPGGFTRYLNLNGSGSFLKHDALDLKYDGTASFKGAVDITGALGQVSFGHGAAWLALRDSLLAHGMTTIIDTNALGELYEVAGSTGGFAIRGFGSADTGLMLIGIPTTPATGGLGADTTGAVTIGGSKKSGTNQTGLAATDNLLVVKTGGQAQLVLKGNGDLLVGTVTATLLSPTVKGHLVIDDNVTSGNPYAQFLWKNASAVARVGYIEALGDVLRVYSSTLGAVIQTWNFITGVTARVPTIVGMNSSGDLSANTADHSLTTVSLPAGSLITTGDAVVVLAWGAMRGVGTAAGTFTLKFGATAVCTFTTVHTGGGDVPWAALVFITRQSATTQLATAVKLDNLGTLVAMERTAPAETLANAITIDFRGTGSTTNDMHLEGFAVLALTQA